MANLGSSTFTLKVKVPTPAPIAGDVPIWQPIPGAYCHICGAQIYSAATGATLDTLLLWQRHGDTGGYMTWRSLDEHSVVDAGMWPALDSPEFTFERRAHSIDGAVDAFGVVHYMGRL